MRRRGLPRHHRAERHGASNSTTSPAPASSATRPSASSTAASSTACCAARAIGELRAADPIKLRGEATTRMIIEGQPNWRADASFDGTLDKLPLTAKLQEPFRADMRGELLSLSSNFHWTGKADVHNFDLQAFGGGSALGIITGPLDVGGEMNAFHARGPLQVPGLGAGAVRHRVRRRLRGSRRERHALRSHAPGHRQPRRGPGHDRDRRERAQTTAVRRLARTALAAGRAVHGGNAADLLEPRGQVSARRTLALRDHGQRRSVSFRSSIR